MRPRKSKTDSLTFVHDGRTVMVDLGAPMPVWRAGMRMVRLIDLWVATMLPEDVLDVRFTLVTSGSPAQVVTVDGLSFARGFIALDTRALFWPDGENAPLAGSRATTIVAHGSASARKERGASAGRVAPVVDLRKLLPILSAPYPTVAWRLAEAREARPA